MLTGHYVPGDSLVHRTPPVVKLAVLAGLLLLVGLVPSEPVVLGVGLLVAAAYSLAGQGVRAAWEEIAPLRWFLVLLVPFQWWSTGWRQTLVVVSSLVVGVAAAGLLTRTTRSADLLDALGVAVRPLRHVGVDPGRVALTLSLTIRSIPVVRSIVEETRQARRARGLERSLQALATPVVVRTVRHADRVGEALAARGLDD